MCHKREQRPLPMGSQRAHLLSPKPSQRVPTMGQEQATLVRVDTVSDKGLAPTRSNQSNGI